MIMGDESTNMDHISLVIKFIKHANQKKKKQKRNWILNFFL